MIKNITINENWFYHRIDEENLEGILETKAILSKRKSNKKLDGRFYNWNGLDYISLSKKTKTIINSSYRKIIRGQYALIFENVEDAIKTTYVEDFYDLYELISRILKKRRYSCYKDEWQVRDSLSLDKLRAIKLPEKEKYTDKDKKILEILDKYDYQGSFIDIEAEKEIDRNDIDKYLIKR